MRVLVCGEVTLGKLALICDNAGVKASANHSSPLDLCYDDSTWG